MPAEATGLLVDMLEGYYELKDGLVLEDEQAVQDGFSTLSEASSKLAAFMQTSGTGNFPIWDSITSALGVMQNLARRAFDHWRPPFQSLSSSLFALCQKVNLRGAAIFRFYDPAAFNDEGAYWLSYSPEIRNPYFGPRMPEWGERVDSLP